MYALCGCALLWSIQSLQILSLTPLPPTLHFSTTFNTHPYILCLHILWYAILLMLYHSLFLWNSFFPEFHRVVHCYKHVLLLSLYTIMLVFVYTLILGSIFHI
jgi:hypothetical protein